MMATYLYACRECGTEREVRHSMNQASEYRQTICASCGGLTQHRRIYTKPLLAPDGTYSYAART